MSFCYGEATDVHQDECGGFVVRVGNEDVVGLRLVLATGVVDRFPEVQGFFEHYGASVFHCAMCDGYEAEGRTVVILLIAERPQGTFSRQLFLGDTLDADKIDADYATGVLTLRIPVAERAKPRRLTVNNGEREPSALSA